MNKYESVVIINPAVEDDKLKKLEKTFTDLINKQGKVEKVEEVGKKKLAYEIKKNAEGIYVEFYFEAEPELISELERNYRITDEVLKFIVIRVEE
jgi:small subunit ribosomal protein S6